MNLNHPEETEGPPDEEIRAAEASLEKDAEAEMEELTSVLISLGLSRWQILCAEVDGLRERVKRELTAQWHKDECSEVVAKRSAIERRDQMLPRVDCNCGYGPLRTKYLLPERRPLQLFSPEEWEQMERDGFLLRGGEIRNWETEKQGRREGLLKGRTWLSILVGLAATLYWLWDAGLEARLFVVMIAVALLFLLPRIVVSVDQKVRTSVR